VTTLILVRHGETDWNFERRVQGHSDRPLNEKGRAQAHDLAEALAGEQLDAVYSSDLVRAHETARIVAERHRLEVTVVPDLREKNFGTWEGFTDDEIVARFPEARGGPWGDAETSEDLSERVLAALQRIADAHAGERVLVVSHGGSMRSALRHCGCEASETVANCQIVRLAVEDGRMRRID